MNYGLKTETANSWLVKGAKKDSQSITSDWQFTNQRLIEGVEIKEVKNIPKGNGYLTEIYRHDWDLSLKKIEQVFQVHLHPYELSAWHSHEFTTDRLFVNTGLIKIVLYDGRESSPTFNQVNEFILGEIRPALIVIPQKVWHGIKNMQSEKSNIINIVDRAYNYEDPDHWRVTPDSNEIPYRF